MTSDYCLLCLLLSVYVWNDHLCRRRCDKLSCDVHIYTHLYTFDLVLCVCNSVRIGQFFIVALFLIAIFMQRPTLLLLYSAVRSVLIKTFYWKLPSSTAY